MLNKYPLWKNLLIVLTLLIGVVYAVPNLYPDDYAVQVSGASTSTALTQETLDKALAGLEQAGVAYRGAEVLEKGLLIRVASSDEQLRAKAAISRVLGDNYVTALNLAATLSPSGWMCMSVRLRPNCVASGSVTAASSIMLMAV